MSDDSRIDSILGDWRARRDAGEAVSQDDVIAAHPDLADSLRARFDALAAIAAARQPKLRDVSAERYADFRVLGQGGMGIVYWALDTDLNRQVAFKVVRPDAGQTAAPTPPAPIGLTPPTGGTPATQAFATLKARFLQEAWVTAGLEHPGIVPVYEVGQTPEGVPYYTMRFVRGSRTFAAAIEDAKGKSMDERLALLDPFLKICDTIRYAHAHGVVHRDLKPDNVALGEFGEVVVLDWGLAKMTGKPDAFAETWQHKLQEYRDAADLKTMASALGTPGYMAPEAALGRVAEVDAKSDVYSLGAILFQILSGRLAYEFRSYGELAMKLMREDAPDATTIDAAAPPELASIAAKALIRSRDARTQSVDALVADVRGWQTRRAADRELDALREQASAAFDAAQDLSGDLRLHQLDRAAAACDQVLAKRGGDARAGALLRDIDALRTRGIAEREQAARNRALRRAGVAALVVAVVAGAIVGKVLDGRRREAEDARAATALERDAKSAALAAETREREAKQAALERAERERTRADGEATEARAQRDRARGLLLVHASEEAAHADPTLALLLARAAVERAPTSQAVSALHAMLSVAHRTGAQIDVPGVCEFAAFSPDGARLATVGEEGGVLLWDRAGRRVDSFDGGGSASFSPDGKRLAVGAPDGDARVWSLADRTSVSLRADAKAVVQALFSPRGDHVATSSLGGTIRVWDAAGARVAEIRAGGAAAPEIRFSPDGAAILGACGKTARLWRLDGTQIAELSGHAPEIVVAEFSPTGELVATGSMDGTARLWRLDGTVAATLGAGGGGGPDDAVMSVAFAPDGTRIATAGGDGAPKLWSVDGALLATLPRHEMARVSFFPDGGRILSAGFDGVTRIVDVAGKELVAFDAPRIDGTGMREMEKAVVAAVVSPDGARIFTSYMGGVERMWSFEAGEDEVIRAAGTSEVGAVADDGDVVAFAEGDAVAMWSATLRTPRRSAAGAGIVAVAAAGDRIVVGVDAADCGAVVFDGDARQIARLPTQPGRIEAIAVSPDGSRIVTAAHGPVCFWDRQGALIATGSRHSGYVSALHFLPGGDGVVSSCFDGTVVLWDRDGKALRAVVTGRGYLEDARPSPKGDMLVLRRENSSWAEIVRLDGATVATLDTKGATVVSAAFTPSADAVFTLAGDGLVRIWSLEGRVTATYGSPEIQPRSISFAADGRRFVTTGADGAARIYDLAAGEPIVLRDPESAIVHARFERTGARVLTVSAKGVLRLWLTDAAALVARAREASPREFTDVERTRYGELLGEEARRDGK